MEHTHRTTQVEVARIMADFLLTQAQHQFFLSRLDDCLENRILMALQKANREQISDCLLHRWDSSRMAYNLGLCLEVAGFNHYTLTRLLSGKSVEVPSFSYDANRSCYAMHTASI